MIADADRKRPAAAALTDDVDDHRGAQTGEQLERRCDGFGLAALFRPDAGIGARGVDEGHERPLEFLGQPHDALSFAVALGMRHAEVAEQIVFGVTAFLLTNDEYR